MRARGCVGACVCVLACMYSSRSCVHWFHMACVCVHTRVITRMRMCPGSSVVCARVCVCPSMFVFVWGVGGQADTRENV